MNALRIEQVTRQGGTAHFRFSTPSSSKQGRGFNSLQQLTDAYNAALDAVGAEALIALAIHKVGVANADGLEGKTITLQIDVTIT